MALAGTKARRRLGLAERPELLDSSFGSATRPWERAHKQRQHDQKQAASAALYNDDVGTHTNTRYYTHTKHTHFVQQLSLNKQSKVAGGADHSTQSRLGARLYVDGEKQKDFTARKLQNLSLCLFLLHALQKKTKKQTHSQLTVPEEE